MMVTLRCFAEYFGADKALVRIIGAALMMVTGFFPGVFLYIIAAVIMPEKIDKDNDDVIEGEFHEK